MSPHDKRVMAERRDQRWMELEAKARRARELLREGLNYKIIAERLGIGVDLARKMACGTWKPKEFKR